MSYRFIPQLTDEEIRRKQLEGLRYTVRQAWNAPQYRAKLQSCGVTPDDVESLDDLRRLPTVDVEDLREGYPLPLLCVPPRDVTRIHASSGTTGKRKILAYTARDIETFSLQIARCYELVGFTPEDRMSTRAVFLSRSGLTSSPMARMSSCASFSDSSMGRPRNTASKRPGFFCTLTSTARSSSLNSSPAMQKILIIEDSRTTARLMANHLREHLGLSYDCVESRREALELLESRASDYFLALCDLNLPDAPNGELVPEILIRGIPVVVVSANFDENVYKRLMPGSVCGRARVISNPGSGSISPSR